MRGAAPRVNNAATIIEMLDMVPERELNSNALDVPVPWAAVPNRMPRAISPRILKIRRTEGPTMEPRMPVMMTNTAVMLGMPPITSETFMAMGVVMERGIRLVASGLLKCIHLAKKAEENMARTEPAATLHMISAAWRFRVRKFL